MSSASSPEPHRATAQDPGALLAALKRLEAVNEIARVLERTLDLDRMVETVVDRILAIMKADRAFMVFPLDPDSPVIRVPIERTSPAYPGAFAVGVDIPMNPGGAAIFREALGSEGPICFGPQRPFPDDEGVMEHFQVQSFMAIAIRPRLGPPWLLGLHQCDHARVWSPDDRAVFKDIAGRMADAFSNVLYHQELERSEMRHRGVLDSLREAVLQLGPGLKVVYANPAWGALAGEGATFLETLVPKDRAAIEDQLRRLQAGVEAPADFEARITAADGTTRSVAGSARATASLLTVALRDVTDRLQAERIRNELAAEKEANRLKTVFVNAISHDLRTPLTSVRGYAEFLEEELSGPLTAQQHEFVHEIQQATRRLEHLVDDLLDFARLEAGTFDLRAEPEDLRDTVRTVLRSLRPQAAAGRLTLEADMPEAPLVAVLDAPRIERVLINLISNAIKFTPPGGAIRVRASLAPDAVRCEVADTGVGIAEAEQAQLFVPFHQLELGKRKGGTGLGLSISKAIVESHGGAIGVESTPGEGSIFWFTLPRPAA